MEVRIRAKEAEWDNRRVEDVWAACSDPDRLKRWFLPVSGELKPLSTGIIYCIAITRTAHIADYARAVAVADSIATRAPPRR